MAEVTIVKRGGKLFPPTMGVILGGVEVTFTRAWVDGERVMVATLPDDGTPEAQAVLAQVAMLPNYRVPRSPKVVPVDAPKAPPVVSVQPPMTPLDIARKNGWQAGDLEGTGQGGAWGPDGGRSPVSGLSAAEMALCSPPKGWRRAQQWPWDVGAWRGPAADWKPPATPSKVAPEEAPVKPVAPAKPAEVAKAVEPEPDTAADLSGYGSGSDLKEALAILVELDGSGSAPTRQKANYHFKKHGLPAPTEQQFQAMLKSLS